MKLFLIRHGETQGNAERRLQHPETPLSERGCDQAERLAGRLAGEGIARILSSDYARAAMTAERVGAAAAAPVELEPLLRERSFGDLRGRAYADLDFDPFAPDYAPPGGESWDVFRARVASAWERVAAEIPRTEGNLAVVTHGLVCHVLAERHLCLDETPVIGFPNTAVTVVDPAPPWRVWLLGCVSHLDDHDGDPSSDASAEGRGSAPSARAPSRRRA